MRLTILAALALPLAGCAVVPDPAWTFAPAQGGAAAATPVPVPGPELMALRQQRDALRARIAQEPDARRRLPLYAELHRVGVALSAHERELYAGPAWR